MNKKMIKVLGILLIVMTLITVTTSVFAADAADEFTPEKVKEKIDTSETGKVQDVGGQVVGIISVVGMIASVAILMVLGIKYMMGSAEEKAEYKKTLLPYVIGAVLLFAAAGIAQGLYTTFKGWGDSGNENSKITTSYMVHM